MRAAIWVLVLLAGCGPKRASSADGSTGTGSSDTLGTTDGGMTDGDVECQHDFECPIDSRCRDGECRSVCRDEAGGAVGPSSTRPSFGFDEDLEEDDDIRDAHRGLFFDASSCTCRKHTHCAIDETCGAPPLDCNCQPSDACQSDSGCAHLPGRQFCIEDVCQGVACSDVEDCPAPALCVAGSCYLPEHPDDCEDTGEALLHRGHTAVAVDTAFVAAAALDDVVQVMTAGASELSLWQVEPDGNELILLDTLMLGSIVGLAAAAEGELRFVAAEAHGVTVFDTTDGSLAVVQTHMSGCEAFQVQMARVDVGEHSDVLLWSRCTNEELVELVFDEHTGIPPTSTTLKQPAWRAGRPLAQTLCSSSWYEFEAGHVPRRFAIDWMGRVEEDDGLSRPFLGYGEITEEVFVSGTTWYGPETSAGGVFIFNGHHGTRVLETSAEPRGQDDDGPILVPTGTHGVDVFWFSRGDACRQTFTFDLPVSAVSGVGRGGEGRRAFVLAGDAVHVLSR